MAMVLAYGAVGMSSKSKEQAYEYLMLLLNDKAEQEKGAEFTPLQGMLHTSGVPVQERAWKSALEQSGDHAELYRAGWRILCVRRRQESESKSRADDSAGNADGQKRDSGSMRQGSGAGSKGI